MGPTPSPLGIELLAPHIHVEEQEKQRVLRLPVMAASTTSPITDSPKQAGRTTRRPRSRPRATCPWSRRPSIPTAHAGRRSCGSIPTGTTDELPSLLAKANREPLTKAEAWALAEALRNQEPWLAWAGTREARPFCVDPVALHIHERVSTQAILRVAARQDVMRSLFAEQEYNEAMQLYQHDVDWSNRLILGDSLQVMSSLARREGLGAGADDLHRPAIRDQVL